MTWPLNCGSVADMNDHDAHKTKFHGLLQEQVHHEFTSSDAGSVVVWDHQKAAALFDALAADQPVPSTVIGGQP